MSERKVLNKYYPPDFDPSKIPKMRGPKNRTFSIRIMAPFNMRCNTCGEYIYKGKKFNSRKENVEDDDYLGLRIFRFYIKCPRCVAEIAFKTDLLNTDYTLEAGATRLFEAEKLAQKMAEQERKEKEDEELNPMKVLENRTKQSRNEIEQLDTLEELRNLNTRHARLNFDDIIGQHQALTALDKEELQKLQDQEDERMARELLSQKGKRLPDPDSDEEDQPPRKLVVVQNPTDLLAAPVSEKKPEAWKNGGAMKKTSLQSKTGMAKLVVLKKKAPAETAASKDTNASSALGASLVAPGAVKPSKDPGSSSTTGASVVAPGAVKFSKDPGSSSMTGASVVAPGAIKFSKDPGSSSMTGASVVAPGAVKFSKDLGSSSTTGASLVAPGAVKLSKDPGSSSTTGASRGSSDSLPNGTTSSRPAEPKTGVSLGLGLLGSYSDSDSSD